MATPEPLRVFWQPGCSSCLAAKEFLTSRDIPFDSVNVRTAPDAPAMLAELGVRTVPVVARGRDFVLAQDLDELAQFVGVIFERDRLDAAELVERLDRLLEAAGRFVAALPDDALATPLRGREDRSWRALAYHVSVIPEAFIDAAEGGELAYAYYERLPPDDVDTPAALVRCYQTARERLAAWWSANARTLPPTLRTYYGEPRTQTVLERTTWHVAQHVRQLESLALAAGEKRIQRLSERELAGLPLPTEIWDDELEMTKQEND